MPPYLRWEIPLLAYLTNSMMLPLFYFVNTKSQMDMTKFAAFWIVFVTPILTVGSRIINFALMKIHTPSTSCLISEKDSLTPTGPRTYIVPLLIPKCQLERLSKPLWLVSWLATTCWMETCYISCMPGFASWWRETWLVISQITSTILLKRNRTNLAAIVDYNNWEMEIKRIDCYF